MSDRDLNSQLEEIKRKNRSRADKAPAHSPLERLVSAAESEQQRYSGSPAGLETRIMGSILEQEHASWHAWFYRYSRALSACFSLALIVGVACLLGPQMLSSPRVDAPSAAPAYTTSPDSGRHAPRRITYNDGRVVEATNGILLHAEGSIGALAALALAVAAVLSALLRRFRLSALFLLLSIVIFLARILLAKIPL